MRTRRLGPAFVMTVLVAWVTVTSSASATATSPTSPVDLATPVNFAAGHANSGAVVRAGHARFEVLRDGLIRMEYSPSGRFENAPTVNAVRRRFAVPSFTTSRSGGWLTIATSQATLRYQLRSGPFGPSNVTVKFANGGSSRTVSPDWQNECPFDQVCEAGAATLTGGANIATDHADYQSVAGFISGLGQGNQAAAEWKVLGAPARQATVTLRYSNYIGALGGPAPRTIDLTVNGNDVRTLTLPATSSWDAWSTVTTTVNLSAGTNKVGVLCAASDSCNVNLDTLSVSPVGASAPRKPTMAYLGGYTRGFDTATYGPRYSCPKGTPSASQCSAALPEMHPGILDRQGYRLLDDTESSVWTSNGWVSDRPAGGDMQDGYLFVYGRHYGQALRNLSRLTGPSPLLPESTFGVWYSDYHAYSTSDYENSLIPQFRSHHVPLDTLSVDTDWKSPNHWDGWEWNPSLFPDPQAFLTWAKQQGIDVTLNIHASIANNDPKLPATEAIAGTSLAQNTNCFTPDGQCKTWDWSSVAQAESYFALHQPFESQGASFWWLDWCCDNSTASMPGVTPDNWINHLYAQELANKHERGFVLSRTGSSYQNPDEVYPAGPWAGHTSTLAFTGDTWGTWNTLELQSQLASDEASIDEPYVSDDIGSFLGPPPGNPSDDPDLYARWVQLGTFQPLLRLHSSDGNRLPWQYPEPADSTAAAFLRLREALVPYTYTLADRAVRTGLPITAPLYLNYPSRARAYSHPDEYLYGPDVLVAPVNNPGAVASESVWLPPGRWTDWFTGATFTGPSTQSLNVPLNRMPVFVKAGGIVPEQSPMSHVGADPSASTILRVYPGASGSFSLYQDAGTGTGYEHGQASHTLISTWPGGASGQGNSSQTTVRIGAARGTYPGQPSSRSFSVQIKGITRPHNVMLDGRHLSSGAWSYKAETHTLTVPVDHLARSSTATVTEIGGSPITSAEPAAVDLSISPSTPLSVPAGGSTTVTTTEHDVGPGAADSMSVSLSAPSGWTVKPSPPVSAGNLAQGASTSQSWTVTAPSGSSSPVTAALQAKASYTSAGQSEEVTTTQQGPPAAAPLPPPVINSATPSSTAPGTTVTLNGENFGDTQGDSYLTLAQGGTSWGAPYDGAKLTITSWSDTSITFQLPPDSGTFPLTPGSATVTVTVAGQTSPPQTLTITGTSGPSPSIGSVTPSSAAPGSTVTLSGQNFGATQGDSYLTLAQGGTSWGAPYDGAKLTITSWSDSSITFQLPPASGSFPISSGSATVTVTVGSQTSNSETITVT